LEEYDRYNRIELYDPYPFQREFHYVHGFKTTEPAQQRALICANQIGKTTCAAAEVAHHATGIYPENWDGPRFDRPVVWLCAGVSNDSTKKILQTELLGGMETEPTFGTGMIPKTMIGTVTRKAGVPDAYESITVKGKYGESRIWLMAYEQGWQKFQGIRFDGAWLDEEPPLDVWSQCIRGTISKEKSIIMLTMTPESGVTEVVAGFLNDLKEGQALVQATWDDAVHDNDNALHKKGDTHLTEKRKAQLLEQIPAHQREMRSKGIPFMGSGLVFPVNDEDIIIEPIEILDHWAQVIGIDFGMDHPFAAVRLCWDKDDDCIYLTHEYRVSGKTPPKHCEVINHWGGWQPVMWPHDGIIRDKGSGVPLAKQYRRSPDNPGGLKMHYEKFSNPPGMGQKEGEGGQGVEVGLMEMLTYMEAGKFKVFSTCKSWLEEKRMYHRKNGNLVRLREDLISASRYAFMMRRFAKTKKRDFGGEIVYDNRGIL
jgi:phage terminase large subunit-like protein